MPKTGIVINTKIQTGYSGSDESCPHEAAVHEICVYSKQQRNECHHERKGKKSNKECIQSQFYPVDIYFADSFVFHGLLLNIVTCSHYLDLRP